MGGRFTVADINTAECLRYAQGHPTLLGEFPAVKSWLERCQARPAFQDMWTRRTARTGLRGRLRLNFAHFSVY